MTTRALEDHEIKSVFEHVSGYNAKRNETILIVGIGMALRVSELVGLKVGDVLSVSQKLSELFVKRTKRLKLASVVAIGSRVLSERQSLPVNTKW